MNASQTNLYRFVAAIDELVDRQLRLVVADPDFVQLKASWLGLHWLVRQQDESRGTRIKIINLSRPELEHDVQGAACLAQTLLYHKVYRQGLCTLGGEPFGLLLVDCHLEFLEHLPSEQTRLGVVLAELGEIALCPVVLGMGNHWQQGNPALSCCASRLERVGLSVEYEGYEKIRTKSCARFLAVTWPRFCPDDHSCHSGYALLALVLREYCEYGWFAGLQAWGEGVQCGATLPEGKAEVRLTESVEATFVRLGIMPLASGWLDDTCGFFSMTMADAPPDERSRQLLPPLLIVCRFGHYLKVKTREQVGSTILAREYTNELQRWLDQYCSSSEIRDLSLLAVSPLKWARLSVQEEGTVPGEFTATLELLPHLPPGLRVDALRIHLQLSMPINELSHSAG